MANADVTRSTAETIAFFAAEASSSGADGSAIAEAAALGWRGPLLAEPEHTRFGAIGDKEG